MNLLPVDPENEAFQEAERKLAANTQEISSESESEDSETEKAADSSSDDEPEFTRSRLFQNPTMNFSLNKSSGLDHDQMSVKRLISSWMMLESYMTSKMTKIKFNVK